METDGSKNFVHGNRTMVPAIPILPSDVRSEYRRLLSIPNENLKVQVEVWCNNVIVFQRMFINER